MWRCGPFAGCAAVVFATALPSARDPLWIHRGLVLADVFTCRAACVRDIHKCASLVHRLSSSMCLLFLREAFSLQLLLLMVLSVFVFFCVPFLVESYAAGDRNLKSTWAAMFFILTRGWCTSDSSFFLGLVKNIWPCIR